MQQGKRFRVHFGAKPLFYPVITDGAKGKNFAQIVAAGKRAMV
jgi:hypothetical protein